MGSSTKQKTTNSEYRRLNLKNTPLPICQHPHHCYHLVSFGNRSSGRGGASLQLAGLAVTRPPISRPPRLQPCAAHLLLLMQLQGHLLTSKMTQIEKTKVLFPKKTNTKRITKPSGRSLKGQPVVFTALHLHTWPSCSCTALQGHLLTTLKKESHFCRESDGLVAQLSRIVAIASKHLGTTPLLSQSVQRKTTP